MNPYYELPQDEAGYSFGFLDEYAKREVRRNILKAICIPGYQTPYASREMPMGRGFGTGGLQLTLSLIGRGDTLKVIDQGSDDSMNAVNLRHFIELTCSGVDTTLLKMMMTAKNIKDKSMQLKRFQNQKIHLSFYF